MQCDMRPQGNYRAKPAEAFVLSWVCCTVPRTMPNAYCLEVLSHSTSFPPPFGPPKQFLRDHNGRVATCRPGGRDTVGGLPRFLSRTFYIVFFILPLLEFLLKTCRSFLLVVSLHSLRLNFVFSASVLRVQLPLGYSYEVCLLVTATVCSQWISVGARETIKQIDLADDVNLSNEVLSQR